MIVESFFSFLSTNAGVKALCKSVFPHTIPQGESLPAITYGMDQDERQYTLSAASSLKMAIFDVDCWAEKYTEVHALADAVEAALAGHTGTFGSDTADNIQLERKFDLFEPDTELYRVSMQYKVAYCE